MRRNVVFYVTLQNMRQNKKRTLTCFFGIVFMVLLMTCVFVGKDTGIAYLEQVASLKDGKWHVALYGIAEEDYEKVEALPYVKETALSKYLGHTVFARTGNPEHPYLDVKAYTERCFDWMNIRLLQGRLPESEREILLSESALVDGGDIALGDTVEAEFFTRSITGIDEEVKESVFPFSQMSVKYGETKEVPENFPYYGENTSFRENREYTGERGSFRVVGIMETPGYEQGAGYTAITMSRAEHIAASGTFNLSAVFDLEALTDNYGGELRQIAGSREIDFNNYLLAFSDSSSDTTLNQLIRFMTALFVALIMACSMLLIYNVFQMSFQERSRYLGMLCSVGATGRQKRSSIYFESLYLLAFALPVGMLSGIGAVWIAMEFLRPLLGKLMRLEWIVRSCPVTVRLSPENLLLTAAVSALTVLLSAYLPARKIGKIGPIACIRGNTQKRQREYAMSPAAMGMLGAVGMLARNSLVRNRRGSRSLVSAAAIFLVILAVTAYGSNAIGHIVEVKIGDTFMSVKEGTYDYLLYGDARNANYEAMAREIKADPGVEKTALWGEGGFSGQVPETAYSEEYRKTKKEILDLYGGLPEEESAQEDLPNEEQINLLSLDRESIGKLAESAGVRPERLWDGGTPAALVLNGAELSTDKLQVWGKEPEHYQYSRLERVTDLKEGDAIPVSFYNTQKEEDVEIPLEIAGFVRPEQLDPYVSLDMSNYMWLIVSEDVSQAIRLATDSEGNLSSVIRPLLLIKMNGKETGLIDRLQSLCNNGDVDFMLGEVGYEQTIEAALMKIIHILLGCFVALSSVICLLNLSNSVKGWIAGRRQEFAALRSVGMARGQMRRMLLLESLGIFARAMLPAGIVCGLGILGIRKGIDFIFGNIRVSLPFASISAAVLLAGAILVGMAQVSLNREDGDGYGIDSIDCRR